MFRRVLTLAVSTLLLASMAMAGGVSVTAQSVPQTATVGQPITVAFTVQRCDGQTCAGLHPRLQATCRDRTVTAKARRAQKDGEYYVRLSLPAPGEWTMSVQSGARGALGVIPVRPASIGTVNVKATRS
jgi:hypothetical protein